MRGQGRRSAEGENGEEGEEDPMSLDCPPQQVQFADDGPLKHALREADMPGYTLEKFRTKQLLLKFLLFVTHMHTQIRILSAGSQLCRD